MRIDELPDQYQELALKRRKKKVHKNISLDNAFPWSNTPEGHDFWRKCNDAHWQFPYIPDIPHTNEFKKSAIIIFEAYGAYLVDSRNAKRYGKYYDRGTLYQPPNTKDPYYIIPENKWLFRTEYKKLWKDATEIKLILNKF